MLIVIGKIEDSNGKLEACRLIDTETMNVGDISIKRIKDAVRSNTKIDTRLISTNDCCVGINFVAEKSYTFKQIACD